MRALARLFTPFLLVGFTLLLPACTSDPGVDAAADTSAADAFDGLDAPPDDAQSDAMDVVVDTGPPTYAQVQAIFTNSCAVATTQCHNADAPAGSLHLDVAHALAETVGIASNQVPRLLRIAAGDPANSFLFLKLSQGSLDPLAECTRDAGRITCSAMPAPPASPLNTAQIEMIRRWIELGATP